MSPIAAARLALVFTATAALAACGGGGGDDGVASAPSSAPAPADPPPPAPVRASAFEPADGGVRVDVRPTLAIDFDGALDASTVTAATVTVTRAGAGDGVGAVVPATVAYDATTHRVTVTPATLRHDTLYLVGFTGLQDANHLPVADAHASFSTWVNAVTRVIDHADAPTPFVAQSATLDASGRPLLVVFTDATGATTGVRSFVRPGGSALAATEDWDGPGPDGSWMTADDHRADRTDYQAGLDPLPFGATTTFDAAPGTLASRHASDDSIAWTYDAAGEIVRQTTDVAGPDGVVGTADDIVTVETREFAAGAAGAPDTWTITRTTSTAGIAGAPVVRLQRLVRDDRGNVVRSEDADADGRTVAYDAFVVDAHGNVVTCTHVVDAGADGVWFTADDVVASVTEHDTTR